MFAAVAIGMATFDGLGYTMFTGLFMLLLGAAGALWRDTRNEADRLRARVPAPRANEATRREVVS